MTNCFFLSFHMIIFFYFKEEKEEQLAEVEEVIDLNEEDSHKNHIYEKERQERRQRLGAWKVKIAAAVFISDDLISAYTGIILLAFSFRRSWREQRLKRSD